MNSLVFAFMSAGCASLSSLFFRKNNDNYDINRKNSNGYLVLFYLISLIFSFVFCSDALNVNINLTILSIGACVGCLNSTMMLLTSHTLKQGPAGLTFAFQNASAIFPGVILFLLLGSDFGFSCSYQQLVGMLIVLIGLFLGVNKESTTYPKHSSKFKWLKYALACFFLQILALSFIQARCILFEHKETGLFSNLTLTQADDVWFMPGLFGTSFIMQAVLFLFSKKKLQSNEIIYGSLGGIANFASTILLLLATKIALPFEKGILLPCFSVAAMILCNIWAEKLYDEKFNIRSNLLCSIGLFISSV